MVTHQFINSANWYNAYYRTVASPRRKRPNGSGGLIPWQFEEHIAKGHGRIMPYNPQRPIGHCTVCFGEANILQQEFDIGVEVDCARCGDFAVDFQTAQQLELPY